MLDVEVLSGRIVAAGTAPGPEGSNAHCSSQCLSGSGTEEGMRSTFIQLFAHSWSVRPLIFHKFFILSIISLYHDQMEF